MSRRPVNPARRLADGGSIPFVGSAHSKSRSSPLLSVILLAVGAVLLIGYLYSGSGKTTIEKEALSKVEGVVSCTLEVQRALPVLKKAYGDSMLKVLHVGPETCSVVSKLLKEEDTEAWGVEPYDLDDADANCRSLVRKGIVRVADIKFPLPYRAKSFSLVIVSDAVDYLSPKYLNRTLPELARVSVDGVVIFAGYPGQHRAKVSELSKFGRPAKLRSSTWWIRYFLQNSLEENEVAAKKFDQASVKRSYKPASSALTAVEYTKNDFPPGFIFGSGTSAYQVEGAANEDGRTPSIWDTFAHAGNVLGNGDIACDEYHKYKEDVKLMAKTGLDAYRFSISWSRLIPNGRGPVNPKGLQYYNNLINELISYGIQPHVTLHHSDLPQALEDEYGGWINRMIV
ncbi:hypothetical protein CISIN_1g0095581mg, partial [Citrus sinensis]